MKTSINKSVAALVLVAVFANPISAANFESLTPGTNYPVGATFSDGGLRFEVTGTRGERVAVVRPSGTMANPATTGNMLFTAYRTGVKVILPDGASQATFDYVRGHPDAWLSINGMQVPINSIPTTAPGVTITRPTGPSLGNWGSVLVQGAITSFGVLGTEFGIDNPEISPLPVLAGDYNGDFSVDAADYPVWRKTKQTGTSYGQWRQNFGRSLGGSGSLVSETSTVPEPSFTAVLGSVLLIGFRHNIRHRKASAV
jgi:hypothetical protein